MSAKPRIDVPFACAAILLAAVGIASAEYDFPGREPDRRTINTQQKVDSLFEKGDYKRALFIYREELAPLGDKYAQYMIGFMYLSGRGLPDDVISASAWYRLAAERGDKHFIASRDEVLALLDEEQKRQSDQAYVELRKIYSDATLAANFIEHDLNILSERVTDSRMLKFGVDTSNSNEVLLRQLEERLIFLSAYYQSGEPFAEPELDRYEQLKQRANKLIDGYEARARN